LDEYLLSVWKWDTTTHVHVSFMAQFDVTLDGPSSFEEVTEVVPLHSAHHSAHVNSPGFLFSICPLVLSARHT